MSELNFYLSRTIIGQWFWCALALKSPWIFFSFECSGLKKCRMMLFGCPKQNINRSFLCWDCNYQFETGQLKNVEKLVEQTAQSFKSYNIGMGMCIFVQCVKGSSSLKIKCGPWKVLEKSLKMVPIFVWNLDRSITLTHLLVEILRKNTFWS